MTAAEYGQTFTGEGSGDALYLNLYGIYDLLQYPYNFGNRSGFSGVTYTIEAATGVPEPTSLAILSVGLAGLALRWRRVRTATVL